MLQIILLLLLFILISTLCVEGFTNIKIVPDHRIANKLPVVDKIEKMKIAVVVVATPEIDSYAKYTIPTIEKWCTLHGYKFVLVRRNLIAGAPINFTKIEAMLDILKGDVDYVFHLDADAPVHNIHYKLENIIQTYMNSKSRPLSPVHILFSEDCYSVKDCSKPGRQNSGAFIIKNSTIGRDFLEFWKSSALSGPCHKYINKFPNCQLVLWNCVVPRYRLFMKTIEYNILNGRDGLLVNHFMLGSEKGRVNGMRDIYTQTGGVESLGVYT